MPAVHLAQTNFTAGEVDPLLAARSDVAAYRNAAEKMTNLMLLWQGGARTRPGLSYVATVSHTTPRLGAFIFNATQRYLMVFRASGIDFYTEAGAAAGTIGSCPWTAAQTFDLDFAALGDTIIVTHPEHPPQKIQRTGASSWTRADLTFEENAGGTVMYQPYYKYAPADMTLTPGATTGSGVSLTLSSPGAWTADHVGAIVRYEEKEIEITGVTSATVATGTVRATLPGTSASANWDEATFNDARGYPRTVAFFGNRLVFGGARDRPSGIWLSKIGAYFNFDTGTGLDNEAIWEAVQAEHLSTVKYVRGYRHLLIFTDAGMFYQPSSATRPLTPENWGPLLQHPYGIADTPPRFLDDGALFVHDTGATVREALFSDVQQAYTGDSVSLLSAHLLSSPVDLDVIYGESERPESYAFAVNDDGTLAVFTSLRRQEIAGWVPWETTGDVKSVGVVGETVFFLVERSVNSSTVLYLEKLDHGRAALDAAKRVTSAATRTFSGFSHLEGETVGVVSKGHYLGEFTVSSGTITLDALSPEVTEIEAGFTYTQLLRPLPADLQLADGSARGRMKRLIRALVQVDRSAAFQVQGRAILLDFQGDDFATAAPTKTGLVEARLFGISREAQVDVKVERPQNVTLLGVTREMQING